MRDEATLGSCAYCHTARPLNDEGEWLELDLRISAGHRGNVRWQNSPTEVVGVVICPGCYELPGAEYLREVIQSRYQSPLVGERGCHVTCRGRVRNRSRGGLVSRMISGDSPLLCPVCFSRAAYTQEEPGPPRAGGLARFRRREQVNNG